MKSVRRISLIAICLTLCLSSYTFAAADVNQERVTIKSIIGKAEIRSPKTGKWRVARIGMTIKMKWDVRTYVESSVELNFASGTILNIGENSVVNLSRLIHDNNSSKSNVKVSSGQIWANVKKLVSKKSKFSFETPTAVAAIRGTRLGIQVDKSRSVIDVYEGKVSVRNKGSRKEFMITTRNRAVIKSGQKGVEMVKFEEIKQDSASKSTLPAIFDPYATDSIAIDSIAKADSLASVIDSTGMIDSAIIIDSTKLDSTLMVDSAAISYDSLIIDSSINDTTVSTDTLSVDSTKASDTTNQYTPSEDTVSIVEDTGKNETADVDTAYEDEIVELDTTTEEEESIEELKLTIISPSDNSIVAINQITISGTATQGANVVIGSKIITVSGNSFSMVVDLLPGVNVISVVANLGNQSLQEEITIEFEPPKTNFLSVVKPADGLTIQQPIISVAGATLPGSEVTVDDRNVTVRADGSFTDNIHIPDEEGEYVVIITSVYKGKEITVERNVEYVPEREEFVLTIQSPVNGQKIKTPSFLIAGKSIATAKVYINGKIATVSANGSFNVNQIVSESKIGEFLIEINAANEDGEELSTTITVEVDGTSPAINTSVPTQNVTGQLSGATKSGYFVVQVTDVTPDDKLVLTATINGAEEEFDLERNDQVKIDLDEGKNNYRFILKDRAGNTSSPITGNVYYLPGNLTIDIVEPDESLFDIDDLPPMPQNTGGLSMDVEIEIDDGIGDVPETIRYCKINGAMLKESSNYIYKGNILIKRGVNSFKIEIEDNAGNYKEKRFTITINE